jgi:hypothetical protein
MNRMLVALFVLCLPMLSVAGPPVPPPVQVEVVRDDENPARSPITELISPSRTYTVPEGKRLVIEHVSGVAFADGGDRNPTISYASVQVGIMQDSGQLLGFTHRLPVQQTSEGNFTKSYLVSQLVRLYSDPGSNVRASYAYDGFSDVSVSLTIAGYLVDVP